MAKRKEVDYSNIGVDVDGDILFITVAKYKLLMAKGVVGRYAKDLYLHYMFTARLQGTNTVKANDRYIRKGLGWGSDRLRQAKKLLSALGLIEVTNRRDKAGRIEGWYLTVKTTLVPKQKDGSDIPFD